jgi:hypothetical protein
VKAFDLRLLAERNDNTANLDLFLPLGIHALHRLRLNMFDRLSPKQKQVLFAIALSIATSICKNVTMEYSIEFVDPSRYHFHWDAPLRESIDCLAG